MSAIRRADARFLLPAHPRTAALVGAASGWEAALDAARIELVPPGRAELIVTSTASRSAALEHDPALLLLEGRGAAPAPLRSKQYAAFPSEHRPHMLLAVSADAAHRYAFTRWAVPAGAWRALRNRVAAAVLAAGRVPPPIGRITIAARAAPIPFFVAAATERGVPATSWLLLCPGDDSLSRGVFLLFDGDVDPTHVLKFARIPDYREPFDRDARGLELAQALGGPVAAHAPRLVDRFDVAGLYASIETGGAGMRLVTLLQSRVPERAKRDAIDRVAQWLVDCARHTLRPPEALAAERDRIERDVLPAWSGTGDLAHALEGVPTVFRRGDLGTWNILASESSFTAVDWEDAREHGPPLWDLFYFLTDALAQLDGAGDGPARDAHTRALWRGELPSSQILFAWTRRYVEAIALPHDKVGPLATLLWLTIGLMHRARAQRSGESTALPPAERIASFWLEDELLGPGWDRWSAT